MTGSIVAFETLDCMAKVRVHYRLPAPASAALVERFDDAEVTIQRFSELVAGALDHFTLVQPGLLHATGNFGSHKLIVTYAKSHRERPDEVIAGFEATLEAAGYGPTAYLR